MNKKVMAIVAVIALVAILGICLVACNADSVESKLEKAGYTIVIKTSTDDGWVVNAVKGTDNVTVTKYASTEDAKEAEEAANKTVLGVKLVESVKRVGSIVYTGTEQGVKDAM